ncbi:hypothetical protein [Kineosporia sp. R_H_3]|uniref:hypothetical protein n=1 Tax=Kineosporia sp. R_H_3 TaxID=1961848 RepID=UPI000B4BDC5F|nr:hypothetical protein [Kineosporia sp. R_H_3]
MGILSTTPDGLDVPPPAPGGPRRARPVAWFSPGQLWRTGREVAQGTVFARFADKRDVEAMAPRQFYDLSAVADADEPFVVDYVADTGDGYDATFAVAAHVARGAWAPDDGTPAASLLLFGGDEVYPVASVPEYRARLVTPYAHAWQAFSPGPTFAVPGPTPDGQPARAPYVLAVPGNHDWYDGLAAFRRMFCETWVRDGGTSSDTLQPQHLGSVDRFAGGWSCLQSRSYWAARLPHGWWVWGIDIQLDAPIDAAQLAYFRRAVTQLHGDDQIVLCTARPSWVDEDADTEDWTSNKQVLVWFLDRVLGPEHRHRVRMLVSGDKHHYVRYTREDVAAPADAAATAAPSARPDHLVTCGSGGAYLSSTHHVEPEIVMRWDPVPPRVPVRYTARERYPSAAQSRAVRNRRWLRTAYVNTAGLPALVTGVYAAGAVAVATRSNGWGQLLGVLVAAVLVGLFGYGLSGRDTASRATAVALATGHVAVHAGLVAAVWWLSSSWWAVTDDWPGRLLDLALSAATATAAGLLGTGVLAGYLALADVLGMHHNEAFSGLGVEDYKAHLRMTFTAAGIHVEVFAVGAVPRGQDAAATAAAFTVVDAFDVVRPGPRTPSVVSLPPDVQVAP